MSNEPAATSSVAAPASDHTEGAGESQIACPVCAGPLRFDDFDAVCLVGHSMSVEELMAAAEEKATRAIWSAIRSLEDSASGARWRRNTLPGQTATLDATIEKLEKEAHLLRTLLLRREPAVVNTRHRPGTW